MTLEPVLLALESLAPRLGRASGDAWAMVSRGRAGDLEGLRQSARSLLETVLKDLVATDLGQAPGPATLAALIDLVRQPTNQSVMPAAMHAHLATVQGWGPALADALAGAGATAAVVGWYVQKRGGASVLTPSPAVSIPVFVAPTPPPSSAPPVPSDPFDATFAPMGTPRPAAGAITPADALAQTFAPSRTPPPGTPPPTASSQIAPMSVAGPAAKAPAWRWWVFGGLAMAAVIGGAMALWAHRSPTDAGTLDGRYHRWGEPQPPAGCRDPGEWGTLAPITGDLRALVALPSGRSAEAWYLLARAQVEQGQNASEALQHARACPGFAAADDLQGRVLAIESDQHPDQALALRQMAIAAFDSALTARADFHRARFHRAGVLLKVPGQLEAAVADLRAVVTADPMNGQAHLLLGFALDRQAASELKVADALTQANDATAVERRQFAGRLAEESKLASCRALDLGLTDASARCHRDPP